MNQNIIVGVGNIYACESLYLSKIKPQRKSSSLSTVELKKLISNIKLVLKKAIASGGTTLKDFKSLDGSPGYFEQELLKNLPQQYSGKLDESIESKNKIMDEKMDKLLDLFNSGQKTVQSGQQLASTIGNVKELLTSVEVEPKVDISENKPSKPKSKSSD